MNSSLEEPSALRVCLFGAMRVERGTVPVRLPARKSELLLAYLVLYPGAHAREKLAALLWGDVSDEQARGSLRKALTHLRAALGQDSMVTNRQDVQLNPDLPLWCDAHELNQLTAQKEFPTRNRLDESSQRLGDLYRGDLLAEFYDDWIFPLREEFRARYVETRLRLAQGYRAQSEYARAMAMAQHVLESEPANERAHQQLMFCFVASGDRHAALAQYEKCRRALREDLGAEPARETNALRQWIEQGAIEHTTTEARLTNLPLPYSSFIGRRGETIALKHIVTAGTRLVTLTGPGGSGKTRLAIQTCMDLLDAFPDGVWWVELAPLTDAAHVPAQVAKTLGVREPPDGSLAEMLPAFLQAKQLLLILDNCEHVLNTSAQLAHTLLAHCPRLRILTTSREALRIAGEQIYPVPAMNVPRNDAWSYADLLREFEGVCLFVERAQAMQPAFQLTDRNAAAVAQICARLDGIPLALELAASRVNGLSPQEIAARLDARFELLKDANRAAPPRHQTLRAVLDWSCELLSERERVLFRRLAVFAGGWTLQAAQEICAIPLTPGSPELSRADILDTLAHLIDKSLVTATDFITTTRYGMLETISEYAREMLGAAAEQREIRARHLQTFLDFAELAETKMRGAAQLEWLARLDMELDNVRAALEWAVNYDAESGLRLAGALEWFWNLRGHWSEGAQWLARLLAVSNAPTVGRARALVAASNLKYWGDQDFVTARAWLTESLALYRSFNTQDVWRQAHAFALYGSALEKLGETLPARGAIEMALPLAARAGEAGKWVRAEALMFRGGMSDDANIRRASLEESAALWRELNDNAQLPVVLAHLAWFCVGQRDFSAAQSFASEGFRLTVQIGDRLGEAWYEKLFGDIAHAQGDYARAIAHYQDSRAKFSGLGNSTGIAVIDTNIEHLREKHSG